MKYVGLAKKLKGPGCEYARQGAGSHEIWFHPRTGRAVPIPYHRTKDSGPKLLARILRELEIDRQDFDRA
jgi:predicted RNA binding protein YcfA (HicA-like mRNA interferase family)